jgi:ribosomal-protein-alanine N-acetyltransferase
MKEEPAFTSFTNLFTERLELRQLKITDENEIFFLRSDENNNQFVDRPKPKKIQDARDFIIRINNNIKSHDSFYWAITIKGNSKLIGTICLWNFSEDKKTAEVGYELNPAFQGKGIMDEALKKVVDFSFKTIGLTTLEAVPHKNNLKSISLLIKNNFLHDTTRKVEDNVNNIIFILRN